jgi:fibronectin type 3 domain-containing protein
MTIAAGQSVPFTVTFTPQSSGQVSGTLSFGSNAANSPTVESLTGTGNPVQHHVDLSWDPSVSQVAGYNVYRSLQMGGPYSKLNSSLDSNTAFTDGTVQSGNTYYYATTAVDSSGEESAYSNLAPAVIP